MKKAPMWILAGMTVCLVLFTYGFYLVKNIPCGTVVMQAAVPSGTVEALPTDVSPIQPAVTEPRLVNINSATLEELMTLPGIGQVYAQRILDYREQHGPFQTVTELLNVEGIGSKRLEDILDLITIGG